MELLDFERLQNIFKLENPVGVVKIYFFSQDKEEFILHGGDNELKEFLQACKPLGKTGECYSLGNKVLCCIGDFNKSLIIRRTNVGKSMKQVLEFLKKFNNHQIVFEEFELVEDAVYYLIIASYCYDFLKKPSENKKQFEYALENDKFDKIIKTAHIQNISRFLGDTPANLMTPSLFVEYARKIFENEDVEFQVYEKEYMQENNMNLILSVSQGSVQPPKLLKITYKGRTSDKTDISLVGKGVCFDSGGISIKPSAEMFAMKYDMMGASTLLCAMKLVSALKMEINISGVFPLVENLPSGTATKPGDVFKSMSGKTVEVDNTDAEGRLILVDGLTFAQKDSPRYLIDAATLTGAIIVALGSVNSGFFTHDQEFSDMIYQSGINCNNSLWRMPLSPFYRESLVSHVADINNMGGPGAGSCKAAAFLNEFVDTEKTIWAHFDIAGIMYKSHLPEIYGKGATGLPIPAFIDIFDKIAKKTME